MDVLTRRMKSNCKLGTDDNGRLVLLLRDGWLPVLKVCELGALLDSLECQVRSDDKQAG